MRWRKKDYVQKRFEIACPVCEQFLSATLTLKVKKSKKGKVVWNEP